MYTSPQIPAVQDLRPGQCNDTESQMSNPYVQDFLEEMIDMAFKLRVNVMSQSNSQNE